MRQEILDLLGCQAHELMAGLFYSETLSEYMDL